MTAKPLLVEATRAVRWHPNQHGFLSVPAGQELPEPGTVAAANYAVELTVWPHDSQAYGPHIMFAVLVGIDQGVHIHAAVQATPPHLRVVR